jgi:hypothetical protein
VINTFKEILVLLTLMLLLAGLERLCILTQEQAIGETNGV